MRHAITLAILFPVILMAGATSQAREGAGAPAYAEVHAVFAQHCLSCHDAKEAEGELILESYQSLMKGGAEGPAIVPGNADESRLVGMIEHRTKPFMPPPKKASKLAEVDIALVKAWINAGAPDGPIGTGPSAPIALPKIAPTAPPRQPVNALAFAPGAKRYAIAGFGAVELRSTENRSLVRRLGGMAGNVNAVAFSADGASLYAAAGEPGVKGEVRIFNVADGALIRTLEGHVDAIYCLALSPDGSILVTGSYDQKIKFWHLLSGAEARTLDGHNGGVFEVAFRPDGKVLASASADRTVKLWDVATGDRLDTLSESTKELHTLAWSPDGSRVLAAGVDNRIRAWAISADAKEGTNRAIASQFAHEGSILRIAFSADGSTLISTADNRTAKLWSGNDLSLLRALPEQPDWPTAAAFGPDDKVVMIGRLDGSVDFYDVATAAPVAPPPPAKPELSAAQPRGVQRGVQNRIRLIGKNLGDVTSVAADNEMLKVMLASDAGAVDFVEALITPDPAMPLDGATIRVIGPGGESERITLHVDDLPQHAEQEPADASDAATILPALPVSVWGTLDRPGDADAFTFDAEAGKAVVMDVAAERLKSKADLVLTVLDADGRTLASVNDTDGSRDPVLVFTPPTGGRFTVRVTDLQAGASAEHFYRLSIGHFGVVTASFPLAVPAQSETMIKLLGHNLPPDLSVPLKGGAAGEMTLPLPTPALRPRRELKVLVSDQPAVLEQEPNDTSDRATHLPVGSGADGQLLSNSEETADADLFRFDARAGQQLVIETLAAERGSPADTRLQVLHADGRPVERVLLRAVRDTWITFRPIDSNTASARLPNYEEMDLNQYLYINGEVVKLFLYPRGPDSGFDFYHAGGKRRGYFDTSATAHAMDEPCYIVEAHPPGTSLPPNGLPTFMLHYENDDESGRALGADSRIHFTAPTDGSYLIRVSDTRGVSGDRFVYRLVVREARPDFSVSIEGFNPSIPAGSGRAFTLRAQRADGFDGPIEVEVSGLPPGFGVSSPIVIEAGHLEARGTLFAASDAKAPPAETAMPQVKAKATVNGAEVVKDVQGFSTPTVAAEPALLVDLQAQQPTAPAMYTVDSPAAEIIIAPGQEISAWIRLDRKGHDGSVSLDIENLPHGVIVSDIGLNGVLIPEGQSQRQVFLQCAPWVQEMDRLCFARAREAAEPTSRPVLLRVRRRQ